MTANTVLCGSFTTAQGRSRQPHLFTSLRPQHQACIRHALSQQICSKRSPGLNGIVRAAISTPAIPDIQERLDRYEWDRMNLPDLTGNLQQRYCLI